MVNNLTGGLIVLIFVLVGATAFYPYYTETDTCRSGTTFGSWISATETIYFNDTFPAIGRYFCDIETELTKEECAVQDKLVNSNGCKWGGKVGGTTKLYVMEDPELPSISLINLKTKPTIDAGLNKTTGVKFEIVRENDGINSVMVCNLANITANILPQDITFLLTETNSKTSGHYFSKLEDVSYPTYASSCKPYTTILNGTEKEVPNCTRIQTGTVIRREWVKQDIKVDAVNSETLATAKNVSKGAYKYCVPETIIMEGNDLTSYGNIKMYLNTDKLMLEDRQGSTIWGGDWSRQRLLSWTPADRFWNNTLVNFTLGSFMNVTNVDWQNRNFRIVDLDTNISVPYDCWNDAGTSLLQNLSCNTEDINDMFVFAADGYSNKSMHNYLIVYRNTTGVSATTDAYLLNFYDRTASIATDGTHIVTTLPTVATGFAYVGFNATTADSNIYYITDSAAYTSGGAVFGLSSTGFTAIDDAVEYFTVGAASSGVIYNTKFWFNASAETWSLYNYTNTDAGQNKLYTGRTQPMGFRDKANQVYTQINSWRQMGAGSYNNKFYYAESNYELSINWYQPPLVWTIGDEESQTADLVGGSLNCTQGTNWTTAFNWKETVTYCTSTCSGGNGLFNITFSATEGVSPYDNIDTNDSWFNLMNTSSNGLAIIQVPTPYNIINYSGIWNITTTCFDGSVSAYNTINWTVPNGIVNVTLVNPNVNTSVQNGSYISSVNLRVGCKYGECFNTSAYLDPLRYGG